MKTEDYHNDYTYLSKSFLAKFEISPLHAYHYMTSEKADTDAMRFGRVYHEMIAGTEGWICYDTERRPELDKTMGSRLNMAWRKEIYEKAESDNKDVITFDEQTVIRNMIDVLKKNALVQKINAFDLVQEKAFRAEIDGLKVKCKPDGLQLARGKNKENLVIDWKTCANVHPYRIKYDIIKYGYDIQAGLYSDIISELHGGETNFLFIFQEKNEPYDVLPVLIMSNSEMMKDGSNKWRNYAIQANKCLKSSVWPGVSSGYDAGCLIIN